MERRRTRQVHGWRRDRSYVTNLRKGRIENPGYEKMRPIAKAMGFAPEVWFEDGLGWAIHRTG